MIARTISPPGLHLFPNWIDQREARTLLDHVDQGEWRDDLKRRVQHFGYVYDYRARTVSPDMYLGPLPFWLSRLANRIEGVAEPDAPFDQVIINEYLPGQGIAPHIDCQPCFGDVIASISFGSAVDMIFANRGRSIQETIRLIPGTLMVLNGEARHDWTHAIPARKSDLVDGQRLPRGRRISLTFRSVRL